MVNVFAVLLVAAAVWLLLSPGTAALPRPRHVLAGVAVLVGGTAAAADRLVVLPLVMLAVCGAWWAWGLRTRRRVVARARAEVLAFCELVADELRAGQPVERAVINAAEEVPLLAELAAAARWGGSVADTLDEVARREQLPSLTVLAAAWRISTQTGHGLATNVGAVADHLRAAEATRGVVMSELASARATATLMTALPVFALGMGRGFGADPIGILLGTPLGWACLVLGLALLAAGYAWLAGITRAVEVQL